MTKILLKYCVIGIFITLLASSSLAQAETNDFSDVPVTHPYYTAISYLHEFGKVDGNPDGSFTPDASINRAAVLKIALSGANVDVNESVSSMPFPDVPTDTWFSKYVDTGKQLGIVSGNDLTGLFSPEASVIKAEFIKMMLEAYGIKHESLYSVSKMASDIPDDAWFAPYMNYAFSVGIDVVNEDGLAEPGKVLTRGEVAHMIYMLDLIIRGEATQFLLDQSAAELSQIEVYISIGDIATAKRSSELAHDLAARASMNVTDDMIALGAARLTLAYNELVDAFIFGIQEDFTNAAQSANQAIDSATLAWEANHDLQVTARHIKDSARDILAQVGGVEN